MDLVRLVNSFSTARNSEGAPDLPEVKAQPSFQASCDSNMMSPTEGSGAIVDDCGGKEKSKTCKRCFCILLFFLEFGGYNEQSFNQQRTVDSDAIRDSSWLETRGLCSKLGTDQVDRLICFA